MPSLGRVAPGQQTRWLNLRNDSGSAIPPFGVIQTNGATELGELDDMIKASKPDLVTSFATGGQYVLNGPTTVAAGAYGTCTADYPAYAAWTGSTAPVAGEIWCPQADFYLVKGSATGNAFRIVGNVINNTVLVMPETVPIVKLECKTRLNRGGGCEAYWLVWNSGTSLWERNPGNLTIPYVYGTTGWQGVCFGSDETGLSGASSVSYIDAWLSPQSGHWYALGKGMTYFAGTASGAIASGASGTVVPQVLTGVSVTAVAKYGDVASGDVAPVLWSDDAAAWHILPSGGTLSAGCGLQKSGGEMSVKRSDLIGTNNGLENGSGTCDLKVKAGCGITVGASGVTINRSDLIGTNNGLEAGAGTCDLKVKAGCGIIVDSTGVKFDAATVAGAGLTATGCVLSVSLTAGCGITISGATVTFKRADAIQANGGLEAGGGTCDIRVKAGCGIQIGASGVSIDRAALIDADGGLEAGGGTCDLQIKVGCGVATDVNGLRVYRAELIQANGGLEAGSGTCDLRVKAGCGIAIGATGVKFKNSDVIGNGLRDVGDGCGIEVKPGCGISVSASGVAFDAALVAGDGLETVSTCGIKVKASCGISVTSAGVAINRADLLGTGLAADSGTCNLKVSLTAGCGITVTSGSTVAIDRTALVGTGIVADSGTCNLKVSLTAGDGITVSGATITANIDTAAGLKFDASSPKKIQINAGCGLQFSTGALAVKRADLIQTNGGLTTGSGTCDLKVDLSSTSPLWSASNNSYVVVSDVSWNTSTCIMTKTTKTLTIPNNIPTTYT